MYTQMCFFFNDTATTEIYTLSLHDALPILDDELVAGEAAAEVGLELEAVDEGEVHLVPVGLPPALAAALGRVHGEVGLGQELVGGGGGRGRVGDADAGADEHLTLAGAEPALHLLDDPVGDGLDLVLAGHVLEQHGELVAAEPGRRVRDAEAVQEPAGHAGEELVAGGVAEAVVDPLEVVEVEEQDGDGVAGAAGAG